MKQSLCEQQLTQPGDEGDVWTPPPRGSFAV